MSALQSTNPSENYTLIGSVEPTSSNVLPEIIEQSKQAQKSWKNIPLTERMKLLDGLYHLFESEKESLAHIVALEMGMPIRQARDEVGYGLLYYRWYLDNADEYLSDVITREAETELHIVSYEPKWVIAAITPWNYPFMLCIWACIQPLLAGNTVIWKISKEVILTGKLIGEIIDRSDLPLWVWTEIYGDGSLGDALTDGDIDGITFTGSTRIGESLREKAHEKNIPAVLELGWSAPGIILEDADIDSVIESIYFFRYSNSGQMCDGLKRLIVHESRYHEVVEKLTKVLESKKIWPATDESTDIGPLVSESQRKHLEEQYTDALASGARVLFDLGIPDGLEWAYFWPKLLGGITREMLVWREEVFGPILPIMTFRTLEEAIELANNTPYWLGAYVFTESEPLFRKVARELETSMVQMNTLNYCFPENPFGGRKSSGIGSEHGRWGYTEFTDKKVISILKKF